MGNRNIKFTRDVRDAVANSRTRILNKNSVTFVSGSSLTTNSGSNTNLVSPVVHNLTASGETTFGDYSFPLSDGNANEVLSTDGNGQLSFVAQGGGGAPTDARYVTLSTDATLTQERVLTAGTDIGITDNGAGSTVVISFTGSSGGGAPTDAQYVTLATDGDLSNERVLTAGSNITLTDAGAGGAITVANSNPQVLGVVSTSDQTIISSTTWTKWNEVYLDFDSTGYYAVDGFFIFTSAASADIEFRFNNPSGSATISWQGNWARDNEIYEGLGAPTVSGRGLSTKRAHMPRGVINITSAPATAQVEFRQAASVASDTTVYTSSWLKAIKLN